MRELARWINFKVRAAVVLISMVTSSAELPETLSFSSAETG
jgi:hypothetical protein